MYSADGQLSRLVNNPAYIAPVDERSQSVSPLVFIYVAPCLRGCWFTEGFIVVSANINADQVNAKPEEMHTYPPRRSYDNPPASMPDITQATPNGQSWPTQGNKPANTTTAHAQDLGRIPNHYTGRHERTFFGLGFGGVM